MKPLFAVYVDPSLPCENVDYEFLARQTGIKFFRDLKSTKSDDDFITKQVSGRGGVRSKVETYATYGALSRL